MTEGYSYRDERGASYMDQYDQTNKGYSGAGNKIDEEENCCQNCSKHFLFFVNFFLFLIGIVLIIVGVYVLDNDYSVDGFGSIDIVCWFAIVSGICVTLVGFCGCASAASTNRLVLITFIVFLVFILLVEIALIIMAFVFQGTLKSYLEDQWNDYSAAEQQEIESELGCCSFDDTSSDDCADEVDPESCYDVIKDELFTYIEIIAGVAIGVAIYDIVMIVVATCLCIKRGKGE